MYIYSVFDGLPIQHDGGGVPDGFTSAPPPSPDHTFNGAEWVLDGDKHAARVLAAAKEAQHAISLAYDEILARFASRQLAYKVKEGEAEALKTGGFDTNKMPFISAESQLLGITPEQLADGILAKAAELNQALVALEVQRQRGNLMAEHPENLTLEGIAAARSQALAVVGAIGDALGSAS